MGGEIMDCSHQEAGAALFVLTVRKVAGAGELQRCSSISATPRSGNSRVVAVPVSRGSFGSSMLLAMGGPSADSSWGVAERVAAEWVGVRSRPGQLEA